jgi:L-lactate utilization protein LutB
MDAELRLAAQKAKTGQCVDCGKCVAVCPMAEMYPDFGYAISPRGMVQKALRGLELAGDPGPWRCTLCGACTAACPAGVDCRTLVEELRRIAGADPGASGRTCAQTCATCGEALPSAAVQEYLRGVLPEAAWEFLGLCPACRRLAYARNNSLGS